MPRPIHLPNEDLQRWSAIIDQDPNMPTAMSSNPIIREVLYAGQYLSDQLREQHCPEHIIGQLMYRAGQLSFGQKDPWRVHLDLLERYQTGTLIFEIDPNDQSS